MTLHFFLLVSLLTQDYLQIEDLGCEYFGKNFVESYEAGHLYGGITSPIYKVQYLDEDYVFRFSPSWQSLSRFWKESYISQWMYEKGLSPRVHHVSEKSRAMILEYVPSLRSSSIRRSMNDEGLYYEELGKLIKEMHDSLSLEPFHFIFSTIDWIETEPFPHPQALFVAKNWIEEIEEHFWKAVTPAFCHNDLHLGNILCHHETDEMLLIDWTSATMGDPFFDLAKVTYFLKDKEKLLFYYLGRSPTTRELAHFNLSIALFEMVIAVNQMQTFGNESCHEDYYTECTQMENDYLNLDMTFQSEDGAYIKSLKALKRFLTLAESGQISFWLNNI